MKKEKDKFRHEGHKLVYLNIMMALNWLASIIVLILVISHIFKATNIEAGAVIAWCTMSSGASIWYWKMETTELFKSKEWKEKRKLQKEDGEATEFEKFD